MYAHKKVNTQENDSAQLHCDYKSSSAATVTWIRKNQIILSGPDGDNERDDKYQLFFEAKDAHLNRSTLVVKNVNDHDLGDYVCTVRNSIGNGSATIGLTYEPETPILDDTHIHGDVVTTQWRIKSLQPLSEVMLNYKQKGVSYDGALNHSVVCLLLFSSHLYSS